MVKYHIVQEQGFGAAGLWYAEEKTSFGWERVMFTFAPNAEDANYLLGVERPDSKGFA